MSEGMERPFWLQTPGRSSLKFDGEGLAGRCDPVHPRAGGQRLAAKRGSVLLRSLLPAAPPKPACYVKHLVYALLSS